MQGRLVHRRRLAGKYAAEGWPVAAGAWWDGTRFRCETPSCRIGGLHIAGHGDVAPTGGSLRLPADWASYPHTMLLLTGSGVDALELPARAAEAVQAARGLPTPPAIARLATGRWLLFAATDGTELAEATRSRTGAPAVSHHGRGSYVPLPPSRLAVGPVRWDRRPWASELPSIAALLAQVVPLLPPSAVQRAQLDPTTAGSADPTRGKQ